DVPFPLHPGPLDDSPTAEVPKSDHQDSSPVTLLESKFSSLVLIVALLAPHSVSNAVHYVSWGYHPSYKHFLVFHSLMSLLHSSAISFYAAPNFSAASTLPGKVASLSQESTVQYRFRRRSSR